jgi:hypothetical protein
MSLITEIISALPSGRARLPRRPAPLAIVKDSYLVRLLFALGTPIAAAMIVQQLLLWLPIWLGK